MWNKGVMLEREDMLTLFNKNKQQLKRGRECVRILLSKERLPEGKGVAKPPSNLF